MTLPSEAIRFVTQTEAANAAMDLRARGWRVVAIPKTVTDRAALCEEIGRAIPLDPPMDCQFRKWDAFADSVGAGLYDLGPTPLAFVWLDARPMRRRSPADFANAIDVLEQLAASPEDAWELLGPSKIAVIVGGEPPVSGSSSRDIHRR